MTEFEVREKFFNLTKDRKTIRGFWHRAEGKELRKQIDNTAFKDFSLLQEKIWSVTNSIHLAPKCMECGERSSFYQYAFLDYCGQSCASKAISASKKADGSWVQLQSKMLSSAQSKVAREKRTASRKATYELNGSKIAEAKKKTCLAKYGVDHQFKSKIVKDKTATTNLAKYGYKNAASSPEVISKRISTKLTQYKKDILPKRLELIKAESLLVPLFDLDSFDGCETFYKWLHTSCGNIFLHPLADGCIPTCPNCRPKSKPQQIITDFLNDLGLSIKCNDRKIIFPFELDIIIPNKKIAIEINGIYWHHDGTKSLPLLEKTKMAEANGYQLLHFWDFEINQKFDVVKNIIKSKLGLTDKIGARKCKIKNVSRLESEFFLDQYHLAGSANASKRLGLYYQDELVALATFSKPRFSKDDGLELIRFCTKRNLTVVGGLSRLIKSINTTIISYADRRTSKGCGYLAAGFKLMGISGPNYSYARGNQIIKRYGAMKHKLPALLGEKFNPQLTELENMQSAGFVKFSDCGNLKLKKEK